MELLALSDFNLVARHGGFGKAARESGRPKATLSRRVAELETSLGLRLFERGARTLKLTEEGRALHQRTSVLLGELDQTAADIASGGGEPRGTLRISAPLLFAQAAMGRLAGEFALAHPKVHLEVTSDDRPVDMVEEGYDLVIRVNPGHDESLVGRIFLRDHLLLVASPSLKKPCDGSPVPLVVRQGGGQPQATALELLTSDGALVRYEAKPVLRLSSLLMVRDAVRAGAGAARLPASLVLKDIEAGSLVDWGRLKAPETALWALYPSRRLLNARVSAFLEHLKRAFPNGTPAELAAFMQ